MSHNTNKQFTKPACDYKHKQRYNPANKSFGSQNYKKQQGHTQNVNAMSNQPYDEETAQGYDHGDQFQTYLDLDMQVHSISASRGKKYFANLDLFNEQDKVAKLKFQIDTAAQFVLSI